MGPRRTANSPAVEVQQKAAPATHEEAMVPRPPTRGSDMNKPMVVVGGDSG